MESSFRVNGCCSLLLAPLLFALFPLLVLLPGADVASFCQSLTRPRTEFMLWGDGEGPGKTKMKKPLAFEFGKFELFPTVIPLSPPTSNGSDEEEGARRRCCRRRQGSHGSAGRDHTAFAAQVAGKAA